MLLMRVTAVAGEELPKWIKYPTRYFEKSQAKDVIDSRQY